jgi:hypothetical protein
MFLVLTASSCGYHFSVKDAQLISGGKKLYIPVVDNQTAEPSLAIWMTEALRQEASITGFELSDANGPCLNVEVLSVRAVPRGVSVSGGRFRTREQEIIMTAKFMLSDQSGDSLAFDMSERQSFLSAADLRSTQTNRSVALKVLIKRMAQIGIQRLSKK